MPDSAAVTEGQITWNGNGSFTADTDAAITFSTVLENEGAYRVTVDASDLTGIIEVVVDGAPVTLDQATGVGTTASDQLGSGSKSTITLRVAAGTTVNRITYIKD